MSAESHLFCQLTRDLPIYFTFQMNCSLFCHSGVLFCNLFCGPWQVENEPWFSPVLHVNCQVHGSSVGLQDQGTWPCIWGGRGARLCDPTLLVMIQLWQEGNTCFLSSLPHLLGQCQRTSYPVQTCPWNISECPLWCVGVWLKSLEKGCKKKCWRENSIWGINPNPHL